VAHVFGPVPSRRLGRSLGVDPIPFKTCNWSCVYCQLGRTAPMKVQREVFCPPDEVIQEVKAALKERGPDEIDWITFVGSGEPTLHADLGRMISAVKALTDIPVAVITNGSLLHLPSVREALLPADAVLPSLDAGTADLYRRINRPAKTLTFDRLIEGLAAFRSAYQGKLWIEVMLIRGLNDSAEALAALAEVLGRIGPDEVHLALPTRPPAEAWVEPADDEGIRRAVELLGGLAHLVPPPAGEFDLSGCRDVTEAVLAVIRRHPMEEREVMEALRRWTPREVEDALREVAASGRAQLVERYGRRFWSDAGAQYIEEARCAAPASSRSNEPPKQKKTNGRSRGKPAG